MQRARSLLQAVLRQNSDVELPTVRLSRSKQKQKAIAARLSKQLVMPCHALPRHALPRRGRERERERERERHVLRISWRYQLGLPSVITVPHLHPHVPPPVPPPPINNLLLLLSRDCSNSSCVSGMITTPGPGPPERGSVARKPCVVIIHKYYVIVCMYQCNTKHYSKIVRYSTFIGLQYSTFIRV